MHLFPRDRTYRQKWERFVRQGYEGRSQGKLDPRRYAPRLASFAAHISLDPTPDDFRGLSALVHGLQETIRRNERRNSL